VRLGNLITYDTNSGSLWLQETGEALDGPMKGRKLDFLDEQQWEKRVRWDVWSKQHPHSMVLFCEHCEGATPTR
jgi:hypothetical protein